MVIESLQNPRIKNLVKLQEKSKERKSSNTFVIEGLQENKIALKNGFIPKEIFICPSIYDYKLELNFPITEISVPVFEKVAYRKTTGGIIGIYESKKIDLNSITLGENPLIVVLEAVEKPGNLGAVLRSCDGSGATAVIVCNPLVDFYNPNVIRSSVGTLFSNQIASASKEDVLDYLKSNNIQIVSTFLRDDTISLYEANLAKPSAIVLGTEAFGLSDFWAEESDVLVKIPMLGNVDSLNVSNAAAICVYEALRQRS